MSNHSYYIFNKPYDVLSQFTKEVPQHTTLQDFLDLASDIYPIGRLDRDSEGLLLLTNDNKLKTKLLDPKSKSSKTYIVQVEGAITEEAMSQLSVGVDITLKKGKYKTKPCKASLINEPKIWDRDPPIRIRANIPTTWIQVEITEGKNRQVRKMCAAVGFPCLRLVRTKIKEVSIGDLTIGTYRKLSLTEVGLLSKT